MCVPVSLSLPLIFACLLCCASYVWYSQWKFTIITTVHTFKYTVHVHARSISICTCTCTLYSHLYSNRYGSHVRSMCLSGYYSVYTATHGYVHNDNYAPLLCSSLPPSPPPPPSLPTLPLIIPRCPTHPSLLGQIPSVVYTTDTPSSTLP